MFDALPKAYEPPAVDGYTFWSVYTSDDDAKRAVLDDEAGRAYAIASAASFLDVPVDAVRAELFEHPHYRRRVWHSYIADAYKAKVLYQVEHLELMLRALRKSFRMEA